MSKKIKVLMVDDEKQFRATTKKILNKKGFETVLAGSGEEAIKKLQEHPDVVILDIKMPGMDGHQALKEIKKISPDLPIIMLTGHGALHPLRNHSRKAPLIIFQNRAISTCLRKELLQHTARKKRPPVHWKKKLLRM